MKLKQSTFFFFGVADEICSKPERTSSSRASDDGDELAYRSASKKKKKSLRQVTNPLRL